MQEDQMETKSPDSGGMSDLHLGIALGLFMLYMVSVRFIRWWHVWIKTTDHQVIVLSLLFISSYAIFKIAKFKFEQRKQRKEKEDAILGKTSDSVFLGTTAEGEDVNLKPRQRGMHGGVIGTTNAGKTESTILPVAIQDMEQGRGYILIDGKADSPLLDKQYAYAVKFGRAKDFKLFSLSNIAESHSFNPLIGGTAEEISERVFNSFEFENPHFRSIQYEVFSQVMRVFEAKGEIPTFLKIYQAISNPNLLVNLARNLEDQSLKHWTETFANLQPQDRSQRVSGLIAALSHFAFGKAACLFNTEQSGINLDEALEKNQIIYFQLPVLLSPFLGKASGKLILQCLQSAIANRHRSKTKEKRFFSLFLDDFSEYLYPGFVSILNKSRSANVGVLFAHQALGELKVLGDAVANSILTNTNIKIFMRGNDPDSAEYFSKVVGTIQTTKFTERTVKRFWTNKSTGEASAREAEEFIIHPNEFKRNLGVGEGIMVIPHNQGSKIVKVKFKMFDDLPAIPLNVIPKGAPCGLAQLNPQKQTNQKLAHPEKTMENK